MDNTITAVILFHEIFYFPESLHKNLNIKITVLFERIGGSIQLISNLCFGFLDLPGETIEISKGKDESI